MNKRSKIAVVISILAVLVIAAIFIVGKLQVLHDEASNADSRKRETPMKVTMDFLNGWLIERNSTTTSPFDSGLLKTAPISDEVRAQIERAHANKKSGDVDPVLCLPKVPNKIDGDELLGVMVKQLLS